MSIQVEAERYQHHCGWAGECYDAVRDTGNLQYTITTYSGLSYAGHNTTYDLISKPLSKKEGTLGGVFHPGSGHISSAPVKDGPTNIYDYGQDRITYLKEHADEYNAMVKNYIPEDSGFVTYEYGVVSNNQNQTIPVVS